MTTITDSLLATGSADWGGSGATGQTEVTQDGNTWIEYAPVGCISQTTSPVGMGATGTGVALALLDRDLGTADHDVTIVFEQTNTSQAHAARLRVRCDTVDDIPTPGQTCYEFVRRGTEHELRKRVAGTDTTLDGPDSLSLSTPETMRMTIAGTAIKCYLDGVEVYNITDSSITTGNYVTIGVFRSGLNPAPVIGQFQVVVAGGWTVGHIGMG